MRSFLLASSLKHSPRCTMKRPQLFFTPTSEVRKPAGGSAWLGFLHGKPYVVSQCFGQTADVHAFCMQHLDGHRLCTGDSCQHANQVSREVSSKAKYSTTALNLKLRYSPKFRYDCRNKKLQAPLVQRFPKALPTASRKHCTRRCPTQINPFSRFQGASNGSGSLSRAQRS